MNEQKLEQLLELLVHQQRKQNRRWAFTTALALGLGVPGVMAAASVTVPHTFASNTPALASEVNENFAALSTEATRVSNIVQGPGDATTSNRVVNLAAPLASSDAASKGYVDAAAGSGGGGSVTLIGVTTCPAGWDVALTGTAFFNWFSSTSTPPQATYACFAGAQLNSGGSASLLSTHGASGDTSTFAWTTNQQGSNPATPCVICVK